ncbi:MAG: hypothetical protein Q8S19_09665 [Bacillota bacterium]|nr:hypothetical protein [Bacillota bacterium]
MLCPVCGKKNVLGVDTCAKCGVTLRIVTEQLSGYGSQVVDLGILEEDELQGEREERPKPHAQSSIHTDACREQETNC